MLAGGPWLHRAGTGGGFLPRFFFFKGPFYGPLDELASRDVSPFTVYPFENPSLEGNSNRQKILRHYDSIALLRL